MRLVTGAFLFTAIVCAFAGSAIAQIPNAGFENWSNGDPVSWETGNGLYTFVTQSTSGHGGTYAAQGNVVNMGAFALSAQLICDFTISQRYQAVHGYYQFTPVGGDMFFVSYLDQKGTSGVGSGAFIETNPQAVYKEFVADITYPGADIPDNATLNFKIVGAGGFAHVGSTFIVDDISFGPSTGVNDLPNGLPKAFRLEQNYPNPFNPTTSIIYDVPEQSHVRLTVLNVLGQEVAVLIDQAQTPGRYKAVFNASALPSGAYFYRLSAGGFVQMHKMVLVK